MIVLEDNFNTHIQQKTYIALGSFDGLHIGHISLINKTLELSGKDNASSMVYTFKNHPMSIINKDKVPELLMDNQTKLDMLKSLGVDIVNLVNFNSEYMRISPKDFIIKMINCYNLKGLIVGFNYRFGYKNSGDVELLKKLSKEFNFELHIMNSVMFKDEVVSSSRIRSLINQGNIEEANKMLLKPFMIKGKIVKGKQIGRTIGFPTANLKYDDSFIIPGIGVYFTGVEYNGVIYKGITSVGFNPTVDKTKSHIYIETYILDFNKNIYDEQIKIYFINRIREEKKFESLEELSNQIKKDRHFAEVHELENFT